MLNSVDGTIVSERVSSGFWFSNLAVARDAPRFVVSGEGVLSVYDSETENVAAELPVAPPHPTLRVQRYVAISPDGRRVATNCMDKLRVWDVDREKLIGTLTFRDAARKVFAARLEFSPDGSLLVCASGWTDSILPVFRVDKIIGDRPGPDIKSSLAGLCDCRQFVQLSQVF